VSAPAPRLRLRRVVVTLVVAAAASLLAGVLLIDRVGETIIAERQREVAAAARDYFVDFARQEGLAPLARGIDRHERYRREEGFRYALFSARGQLMGGARLLTWRELPPVGTTRLTIPVGGRPTPWQVFVQPVREGGTLVVYEDLSERTRFRQSLALGGALALLVALGAMLLVSLWLMQLVWRRARSIADTAEAIAAGRTAARAPADPAGDVFDRLGASLNVMLERNEELMTGLRTVTDSLAHDLRSPLTRMKGALTAALDPQADEEARRDAIGQAWEEADRALATTGALLDIARAETGLSRDMLQPLDLGDLAAEVVELFAPVVEDAGQTLTLRALSEPLVLPVHDVLLRQALGNLIYNAARYAGDGARVEVSLEATAGAARIVVADDGPGIPAADRGRVVERFVRLDEARTTPGSGLGLAIAAACAKLHRGQLRLEDNAPGLRAVLELAR
jgi:signal transduction histidine kinase